LQGSVTLDRSVRDSAEGVIGPRAIDWVAFPISHHHGTSSSPDDIRIPDLGSCMEFVDAIAVPGVAAVGQRIPASAIGVMDRHLVCLERHAEAKDCRSQQILSYLAKKSGSGYVATMSMSGERTVSGLRGLIGKLAHIFQSAERANTSVNSGIIPTDRTQSIDAVRVISPRGDLIYKLLRQFHL